MVCCLYCGEKIKEGESTCLSCGRPAPSTKRELTEDFLIKQAVK